MSDDIPDHDFEYRVVVIRPDGSRSLGAPAALEDARVAARWQRESFPADGRVEIEGRIVGPWQRIQDDT